MRRSDCINLHRATALISCLLACAIAIEARAEGGLVNPAVTQDTIASTICVEGWTKTVRPPVYYTNSIKRELLPPGGEMRDYELDHIIPLALGGHPTDRRNLMLQPWGGEWGARTKDRLELRLHREVCAGRVPLEAAQDAIAADWVAAYRRWCPTRADCPSWTELHGRR